MTSGYWRSFFPHGAKYATSPCRRPATVLIRVSLCHLKNKRNTTYSTISFNDNLSIGRQSSDPSVHEHIRKETTLTRCVAVLALALTLLVVTLLNTRAPSGAAPQRPCPPQESSRGLYTRHVGSYPTRRRGLIYRPMARFLWTCWWETSLEDERHSDPRLQNLWAGGY